MIEQMLSLFVSNAYAVDPMGPPPGAQQGGGMSILFMFGIFIVFMYFAVWRPQSKRAREQQNLLSSLAKGDEVVTTGGMVGRITKIADQYVSIGVAENVEIVLQKSAIANVLPKGTLKTIE